MTTADDLLRPSASDGLSRKVGLILRSARQAKGLNAEEAASQAGIAPKTWARAEAGEPIRAGSWSKMEAFFALPDGTVTKALQQDDGWRRLADTLGVSPAIAAGERRSPSRIRLASELLADLTADPDRTLHDERLRLVLLDVLNELAAAPAAYHGALQQLADQGVGTWPAA